MTFLSITPDAFHTTRSPAVLARRAQAGRPHAIGHLAAMVILASVLTVPGTVVQAKWSKLDLVFRIVQQRCMASVSA